jgi:hypothetical protein
MTQIKRTHSSITSIMFLDIIHRLVHFLKKHNVSETGFCLRPQVKPTQLDPIDREIETLCFFKKWTRRWIMSKNIILLIIYHRHKRLNLIRTHSILHQAVLPDRPDILVKLIDHSPLKNISDYVTSSVSHSSEIHKIFSFSYSSGRNTAQEGGITRTDKL